MLHNVCSLPDPIETLETNPKDPRESSAGAICPSPHKNTFKNYL